MQKILDIIKKLLPAAALKKIRPIGHGFLAFIAAMRYGFPSAQMIVIGVTGTAGKSTTIQMLSRILNASGKKTGYTTTISCFNGNAEIMTPDGMSMPGRFRLQANLRQMLENDCAVAIVECTSEGLAQNRHYGVNFDMALLTLLAPAHIEAHGGFDNYKASKMKLFSRLAGSRKKSFFRRKIAGANLDNEWAESFLKIGSAEKFGTTFEARSTVSAERIYAGHGFTERADSSEYAVNGVGFTLPLPGKFNAYNALLASAAAAELGVPLAKSAAALRGQTSIPGRMEKIPNNRGFTVFLDYGAEPVSMQAALDTVASLPHNRIIHVFGSAGGHRDVGKRFEFGEITGRVSDIAVLCNEDVYDSDPNEIVRNIKQGIDRLPDAERKTRDVQIILDRGQAIKYAIDIAQPGDTVIVTGKGVEQFMYLPGNKRVEWNDKKALQKYLA